MNIRIITLLLLLATTLNLNISQAQNPGDTTWVQAFTFGSPQNAWFQFPDSSQSFEKILMLYTLKCNPAQNPKCGEWDYLTYNYLYDHTGVFDSTLLSQPSFVVNGASPDSFQYISSPTYTYEARLETFVTRTDTISLNLASIGNGASTTDECTSTSESDGVARYLWKASELLTAGLDSGMITGMHLNVNTVGSQLNNFTIKIQKTSLDSLTIDNAPTTGYDAVYEFSQTLTSGINYLLFTTQFLWDDTSNLIVSFEFDNTETGTNNILAADNTPFPSGVFAAQTDYVLDFEGADYVDVPAAAFANIDSHITISLWQYGDPTLQPQNDAIFEGLDAAGNRVLNVHLPWSNSNVYWDAGNDGSTNDRINALTNAVYFEGQWNNWVFTKNVQTGLMRVFLNGQIFLQGVNKKLDMSGIVKFRIGSAGNGTSNYDGMINEFSIWNVDLDQTTVQNWMNRDIDNTHPNYANLQAYYKFNEGTSYTTADASPNRFDAGLAGVPQWLTLFNGENLRNWQNTNLRPQVTFEQGEFTSTVNATLIIDSTQNAPVSLVLYQNASNPTLATDTQYVWLPSYDNYMYDNQGNATDSTLQTPDNTIYKTELPYYGTPFEVLERYEIGRYITPYGIGLDLGAGFTWVYDVTDYRTLLVDSVHLAAGNWQELLDMKFMLIHGTPTREVVKISNVYANNNFRLSNIDQTVTTQTLPLHPDAESWRLKTRTSGHGFGANNNCAEFCIKNHTVWCEGFMVSQWQVWKDCGWNPLYPQGGTWLYDRAGWCPGDIVDTYDHELTQYVNAASGEVNIDYDSETDVDGNYILEVQLVQYKAPNFTLDVAVTDIIAPSTQQIHGRYNPICDKPLIKIKNNGTTPLTQCDITFGIKGGPQCYYTWNGNLKFTEEAIVELPSFDWSNLDSLESIFQVNVDFPNAYVDQYLLNNNMSSHFDKVPMYDSTVVLQLRTNSAPQENYYELRDETGAILFSGANLPANTLNWDTFYLAPGCYSFILYDTDEDGLSFFANGDGNGYVRLRPLVGTNYINFEPDFGEKIVHKFMVGYRHGTAPALPLCEKPVRIIDSTSSVGTIADPLHSLSVYPNPTTGDFSIKCGFDEATNIVVSVFNSLGVEVYNKAYQNVSNNIVNIDLMDVPNGIYLVTVNSKHGLITQKLLINAN